jgi:sucrose-6-phosphate hydrolase SacC (GH32 family)
MRHVFGCTLLLSLVISPVAIGQEAGRFPPELTRFVPLQKTPVFAASPGKWDAYIRERGWITIEDGLWKLYYTGYDSPDGMRKLGLATSKDGLVWTRHPNNPLVKDHWVEDMMIVKDAGTYWMVAEGKDDLAQLLSSTDGLAWKRHGLLDIRTRKTGQPISPGPYGTPTLLKEKDVWHLFYERNDLGIWLATSKDLKVWTNVQDDPVMKPGPDLYDRDLIALNQVIKYEGRYYAYYHGTANVQEKSKRRWCTCVAVSDDLIHWTKYPNNPLQPLAENKSSGIVVNDGRGFRLYTMHPSVYVHGPAPR